MSPLRLCWWQTKPNFGDRLSAELVAHVSGREVIWAGIKRADMIALGSLMMKVAKRCTSPRSGEPLVIWGTGVMGPVSLDFLPHVEIAGLRGPLTAALLDIRRPISGDPGLLTDQVAGPVERGDRIGFVLHFTVGVDRALRERLEKDGRFDLIDVTDTDHLEVSRRIGRCRHVFSSSLHGLIVADAYGVPKTWLDPAGIHGNAEFKFFDYGLSIGRAFEPPMPLEGIFDTADALPEATGVLPYVEGIARMRKSLVATFPERLRAA